MKISMKILTDAVAFIIGRQEFIKKISPIDKDLRVNPNQIVSKLMSTEENSANIEVYFDYQKTKGSNESIPDILVKLEWTPVLGFSLIDIGLIKSPN